MRGRLITMILDVKKSNRVVSHAAKFEACTDPIFGRFDTLVGCPRGLYFLKF